jgi:hypothetical protein
MENIKMTEEEIQRIKDLQAKQAQAVNAFGVIELDFMKLESQKEQIKQAYIGLQKEEANIAKDLEDKYGQGTISLETGEFSPSK